MKVAVIKNFNDNHLIIMTRLKHILIVYIGEQFSSESYSRILRMTRMHRIANLNMKIRVCTHLACQEK